MQHPLSVQNYREKLPTQYLELHPETPDTIEPFPLTPSCDEIYAHWEREVLPATFILKIPRGRVYSSDGIVITPEGAVLIETSREWKKKLEQHRLFALKELPQTTKVNGKVAVIAAPMANCFYHWMTDILPRIKIVEDSAISYDYLLLPQCLYPFQKESLQLLGIDNSRCLFADDDTLIEADELIVPSMPSKLFRTPQWAVTFLRDIFLPKDATDAPTKNIFIARKMATDPSSQRKIVNEQEVFSLLQKKGFERLYLEDLSLREQAALFHNADTIVTAHGAALTGLIYCREGSRIVEIFNPDHLNGCYYTLCRERNLHHSYIVADNKGLTDDDRRKKNIFVDLKKISDLRDRARLRNS